MKFEERLAVLNDGAKAGSEVPQEVRQRLLFLARVFQAAPPGSTGEVRLLWLDAHGKCLVVTVDAEEVVIGRGASCAVVLASPRVSRRHCVVRRAEAGSAVEIEELGSSNGTLVNGVPLSAFGRSLLRDGAVIEVGGVALAVAIGQAEW